MLSPAGIQLQRAELRAVGPLTQRCMCTEQVPEHCKVQARVPYPRQKIFSFACLGSLFLSNDSTDFSCYQISKQLTDENNFP